MGSIPTGECKLFDLPIHPRTGVQALGFTKHGSPIWPVMGGSQPHGDQGGDNADDAGDSGNGDQGDGSGGDSGNQGGSQGSGSDKGFPENTPIAEMTDAERANYFKFHDRRKSDTLKAYQGITPEQALEWKQQADEARRNGLQPNERALEDARTEAAKVAAEQAAATFAPQLAEAVIEQFVSDDEHKEHLLGLIDPMKFMKDGVFDRGSLVATLTGLSTAFGGNGSGNEKPPPSQWGQSGGRPPAPSASAQGLAEAERRFGKVNS